MKRLLPVLGIFSLFLLFFIACKKEQSQDSGMQAVLQEMRQSFLELDSTECGAVVQKDLWDQAMVEDRGDFSISNDSANVIIRYASNGINDVHVKKIILLYGTRDHVRNGITETNTWTPCDGPAHPDRVKESAAGTFFDSVLIPLSAFHSDSCIYIGAWVTLVNNDGFQWCTFPIPFDENIQGISTWKAYLKYCKQDCGGGGDDSVVCGNLRTVTPGGWGSKPHGNNPGKYLHDNFAAAFPNGVTIGCAPDNFWVKFTSAQAITDYLPAGGEPKKLKKNYTNPKTRDLKNSLAQHVLALTLNVQFDLFDPNFGEGGVHLEDMIINSGKFKGWTVGAFLDLANKVLGGCNTQYKAKDVVGTAEKINEFFKNGRRPGHHGHDDNDDDDHDDDHDDDDHHEGCKPDFLKCPTER